MPVRPTILLLCVVSIIALVNSSWIGRHGKKSVVFGDTTGNFLARYGAYIFNREKCFDCHATGKTNDTNLIRLDGVAGKYPLQWHYNHLVNPRSINLESQMPAYPHLDEKYMNAQRFYSIVPGAGEKEWAELLRQADAFFQRLKVDMTGTEATTELIALLAWLYQLPPDEDRRLEQEMYRAEMVQLRAKLDSQLRHLPESINKKVEDKISIERGKRLFQVSCQVCHGLNASGSVGPNLTDDFWIHCRNNNDIIRIILFGKDGVAMPAWYESYGLNEAVELTAYIRSLKGKVVKGSKEPQGVKRVW